MTKPYCSYLALLAGFLAFSAPAMAKQHAPPAPARDDMSVTPMPAGPPPTPDSPAGGSLVSQPPVLADETSYVLMDGTTGAILAEAAPHLAVAPASLTKLMTAHITYRALHDGSLKLDQTVPVSPEAWKAGGSRMFLDPTSVVTVDQLLHGLIIESGNDAAVALAQQIAGSTTAFVQIMNKDAGTLGLTDTNYTNVTGLPDPALHTSAMDVAILTRVILKDEPEILNISKMQSYTYDNITQASWNPVLQHDPTVDGLKTGLTQESGHCIDATAIRDNMRLIAVVMGGPTWAASTAAIESLLDYGQAFFSDVTIAQTGQQIDLLHSSALDSGVVPVGPGADLLVTLPKTAAKSVTHEITYSTDLSHGVTKGEVLGTISYMAGGKTLGSVPAIALSASKAATFTTKVKREIDRYL
ncbi:MAG: D-alanyl-D-alanine carboxypeptidase [Acidocella sp.]|nr:D-alanyl-D-alanine carboxypeptidase [Acidocella sp.]